MSRVLPYPLLSAALLLMWLMLTRFSLGHAILGGTIAVIAGWSMSALHPADPRIRRWSKIFELCWIVFVDIIRSNIAVATLILSRGRAGRRRSQFIDIHLDLRDRTALAYLAVIITSTPGTAWIDYDASRNVLLIHVFDVIDEDEWRELIKSRYEALLLEIFE